MLAALRLYLRDHGITNPEQTAIVLFKRNDPARFWDRPRDNNPLLIKPSCWTDEDVRMIEENGARKGMRLLTRPVWVRPRLRSLPPHHRSQRRRGRAGGAGGGN